MEKYVPDIYQKSIYTIDYDKLKARGIKCLLYDLDNTLVPFDVKEANQKIKNLFDELKEKGEVMVLRPSRLIEVSRLEKDPEKLKALYQLGREDAMKNLNQIHAFLSK